MDEFDLIDRFFSPLAGPGAYSLKDDVAELDHHTRIVSTDTYVEGRHFPLNWALDKIAPRVLRCAVSDIVAKGASSEAYFLMLSIPDRYQTNDVERFAQGLKAAQSDLEIYLLGGDTTRVKDELSVSLTVTGRVNNRWVRRNGANVGDDIWVTGTIGDSGMGLKYMDDPKCHATWTSAYETPSLALNMYGTLVDYATASADVSDGLLADARHVAHASEVGMDIYLFEVPHSKPTLEHGADLEKRLGYISMGDDYQILFTADPNYREMIKRAEAKTRTRLTRIGTCTDSKIVRVMQDGGKEIDVKTWGYDHFSTS